MKTNEKRKLRRIFKMIFNRIKMVLAAALFMGVAFLMVKGEKVNARTATGSGVESVSESIGSSINGVKVLKDSSGVAELDQAADRTNFDYT